MISETFDKMWDILKENDFQIDVSNKPEIICTSCKHVLIKPRILPCGCRFCYDCLISYLNGDEKMCSGESDYCKRELINIDRNVFIDQAVNIKISRIIVKCPLESCEFQTELEKMADHVRSCDMQPVACPYYAIGCEENKIGVDKMELHFKEENYCHARLLMEFVMNWQNEVRLLKSKVLDLGKENKFIKEQMESKQVKISTLEGNMAKLSCKELDTEKIHGKNQIEEIISEIQRKSKKQKEEIEKHRKRLVEMEEIQEQMRKRIEGISQENKSLRETLEIIKLDNKNKEKIISALETKSKKEEQEIGKEKCELYEENLDKCNTRIDRMPQKNADVTKNEIKILKTTETQVQAYQSVEFLWCIENWIEKKERSRNGIERFISSDSFYSHVGGYKMCLQLFPDGKKSVKGTHLSLFIRIMRGEFDHILEWPFRHVIIFDLIIHETGLVHVSKILDSKNSSTNDCWKKPDKEKNDAIGYPRFIELSELSSNAALCQGNQIWIKATVQLKP